MSQATSLADEPQFGETLEQEMNEQFARRATRGASNALDEAAQGGIQSISRVMDRAVALAGKGDITRANVEEAANDIAKEEAEAEKPKRGLFAAYDPQPINQRREDNHCS